MPICLLVLLVNDLYIGRFILCEKVCKVEDMAISTTTSSNPACVRTRSSVGLSHASSLLQARPNSIGALSLKIAMNIQEAHAEGCIIGDLTSDRVEIDFSAKLLSLSEKQKSEGKKEDIRQLGEIFRRFTKLRKDIVPLDYTNLIADCCRSKRKERPTAQEVVERLQKMLPAFRSQEASSTSTVETEGESTEEETDLSSSGKDIKNSMMPPIEELQEVPPSQRALKIYTASLEALRKLAPFVPGPDFDSKQSPTLESMKEGLKREPSVLRPVITLAEVLMALKELAYPGLNLNELVSIVSKLSIEGVGPPLSQILYLTEVLDQHLVRLQLMFKPDMHQDLWTCLFYFGRWYVARGYRNKAKHYLNLCFELSSKVERSKEEKALLFLNLGKIEVWDRCYREANERFRQATECCPSLNILMTTETLLSLPEKPSSQSLKANLQGLIQVYPPPYKDPEWERVLGRVKEALNLYTEAEQHYRAAIDAYEMHDEIKHPKIALCYQYLGRLKAAQKDWRTAQTFYTQALEHYLQIFGEGHSAVAECFFALATLHENLDDFHQARDCYEKAAKIYRKLWGVHHLAVAECYESIAIQDFDRKSYETARIFCQKALDIYENKTSTDLNREVTCRYMMGNLCYMSDQLLEAKQHYNGILACLESVGKVSMVITQQLLPECIYQLSCLYRKQGDLKKAQGLLDISLNVFKEFENFEGELKCLIELGGNYESSNIEKLYLRAKLLFENLEKTNGQNLGEFRLKLGAIAARIGKREEARTFLHKARDDFIRLMGLESEKVKEIQDFLAKVY